MQNHSFQFLVLFEFFTPSLFLLPDLIFLLPLLTDLMFNSIFILVELFVFFLHFLVSRLDFFLYFFYIIYKGYIGVEVWCCGGYLSFICVLILIFLRYFTIIQRNSIQQTPSATPFTPSPYYYANLHRMKSFVVFINEPSYEILLIIYILHPKKAVYIYY